MTYKGLPGPHICDFMSREQSAANYDDGSTFQIGRIDMVANTGTYVDVPSHRFADGKDLSEVGLEALAHLPAIVVRQPFESGLAVELRLSRPGRPRMRGARRDRLGPALGQRRYYHDHSFLTLAAAELLVGRRRAGRDRQPQYRRHPGADAAGPYRAARRRNPDLRAYDQPRHRCPTAASASPPRRRRSRAWAPSRCAPMPCSAEPALPSASRG